MYRPKGIAGEVVVGAVPGLKVREAGSGVRGAGAAGAGPVARSSSSGRGRPVWPSNSAGLPPCARKA
eukprot:7855376-Lingulodinium_polyedra.AAC.1